MVNSWVNIYIYTVRPMDGSESFRQFFSKECIVASGNGCSNHDGDGVRLLLQSVSITSELLKGLVG